MLVGGLVNFGQSYAKCFPMLPGFMLSWLNRLLAAALSNSGKEKENLCFPKNTIYYSLEVVVFLHILSTPGEASIFFMAQKAQRGAYSTESGYWPFTVFFLTFWICVCVGLDHTSWEPTCCPIWLAFSLIKAFVAPQTGCITISAPWSPVFMATWHYKQG